MTKKKDSSKHRRDTKLDPSIWEIVTWLREHRNSLDSERLHEKIADAIAEAVEKTQLKLNDERESAKNLRAECARLRKAINE